MFPKKGKFFPDRTRRPGSEISVARVISDALRDELCRTTHGTKTVMAWTGASERTVKNWLSARSGPRGAHLICLMRHSRKVLDAVLLLAGREQVIAGTQIAQARNLLADAVSRIDRLMSGQ
jgi:hypothetical protein